MSLLIHDRVLIKEIAFNFVIKGKRIIFISCHFQTEKFMRSNINVIKKTVVNLIYALIEIPVLFMKSINRIFPNVSRSM